MSSDLDLAIKREKELLRDLRVLEGYIKNFWEILPVPVCATNPIFTILEISKSFSSSFGYEPNEVAAGYLGDLFSDGAVFERLTRDLLGKKKITDFDCSLKVKTGPARRMLVSAIVRQDEKGNVAGFIFSFTDITALKKVEDSLQESAKELTDSKQALMNILEDVEAERKIAEEERDRTVAVIKSLADGVIIIEEEIITLFNPKAETFFYLSAVEVVGQNIWSLTEHKKVGGLFRLLKEKGLNIVREELEISTDLILEVSALDIKSLGIEAGKLIILHDITREKAVERMKTEFVSIAAHQLRTPLSAIKWIMNMMLEGDMGNISESQREFLLKTYQSNERMIRLVNDLLNITRIEEGRFLYELVPKDITALVERTVASLQEMAKQRGVKMIVYKPNLVPPPIYIDEEKVAMAIQNLIDNAINYTPSGKEVNVFMDYDLTTDTFLFKVQDEGFGIPPEQQKRIFSRFFRAPNALKADTEGSGLGLFIAKNVVEAHHGKIWFESTEDKGSTFYFTLPRQPR